MPSNLTHANDDLGVGEGGGAVEMWRSRGTVTPLVRARRVVFRPARAPRASNRPPHPPRPSRDTGHARGPPPAQSWLALDWGAATTGHVALPVMASHMRTSSLLGRRVERGPSHGNKEHVYLVATTLGSTVRQSLACCPSSRSPPNLTAPPLHSVLATGVSKQAVVDPASTPIQNNKQADGCPTRWSRLPPRN